MNDSQALTQLAETDAYASVSAMPSSAWSRETARSEIERRMGMDTHESTSKQEATDTTEHLPSSGAADMVVSRQTSGNRRLAALVAAGAFVLVIVVGGGIALMSGDGEPQPFGAESSLTVADEYFAAFNAGDSEAVMALFTSDATFALQFIDDPDEPILRTDWEERLVWDTAQGTVVTTRDCAVIAEAPGAVIVECEFGTHDAPAQAVDAVAVPTKTTMKITSDGIGEFHELFGRPDFTYVGVPFDAWMAENHPDDALATGFGNWSSLEEANEQGRIRAQYAVEWAVDLLASGCSFAQVNC